MPKAMLFESLKTPGTATYVTLYLQLRMESEGLYRDPRTKIIRTRWWLLLGAGVDPMYVYIYI